jgi:hypothetical protein
MMEFRHELKFLMHPHDAAVLKKQLSVMMELDLNGDAQGRYMVRSLYFDTLAGSAFFDKLDGVEYRRKYRIRYYNNDTKFIRLESKLKIDDLSSKTQDRITMETAEQLMRGELGPILLNHNSVLSDFILDMKLNGLKPSVIVDYQRTAYLHQSLDVRITFDEQIRSRIYDTQLFKTKFGSVEVLEPGDVVLEVKYDELIPRFIADILRQVPMTRLAVSKYAYCYNKK